MSFEPGVALTGTLEKSQGKCPRAFLYNLIPIISSHLSYTYLLLHSSNIEDSFHRRIMSRDNAKAGGRIDIKSRHVPYSNFCPFLSSKDLKCALVTRSFSSNHERGGPRL
jgi:hypothetical protein